jgi:hypothetical protein
MMEIPLLNWAVRASLRRADSALRTTRDLAELGLTAVQLAGQLLGIEEEPVPIVVPSEPRPPRAPGPPSEADLRSSAGNGGEPRRAPAPAVDAEILAAEVMGVDTGHIDTEVELVEEVAEPGAEDGAGATIRIAAPFDGYDALRAADVIARLPGSDAATLGAIEMYESTHRRRRSVLDAVARQARRRA